MLTHIIGGQWQKPGVVVTGGDSNLGGRADVALNGFNVRLFCADEALAFSHLLRVRCEDLARFLRGGKGEGGVGKVPGSAPGDKMTGSRERSAMVALSS